MSIARETAGRLADQIKETVTGRGANYGPPEVNFENIAAFWRAWLKARHGIAVPLDGHDVGQMSALIKLARLAQTPVHEDSALDAAIYVMLGHGCAVDASQVEATIQADQTVFDLVKEAFKEPASRHNEGRMPVSAGTVVEVVLRDGSVVGRQAGSLTWAIKQQPADIIWWRAL